MKKIYSLLFFAAFLFSAHIASAQSQRLVLIEEGTNASCGPCATQNPGFYDLLDSVDDKVVGLTYQWWYPGFDPMYEHNPVEVDYRFETYYGQNGVPTAMIDGDVPDGSTPGFNGQWYAGAPGGYSATMINNRYAVPSPFDIEINYTLTPSNIEATVTVTCTQAISESNLKLRVAVIEKLIMFDTPPGSTNQVEFHNVLKKFIGGTSGFDLQNSWVPGDSQSFTGSWTHANVYEFDELAVVAFVQNDSGKEVLQASMNDEGVLEANLTNAGGIFNLQTSAEVCSGPNTISPTVSLRNTGNATLTSARLKATINGTEAFHDWTGSLELMEDAEVTFDAFTFDASVGQDSDLTIEIIEVNDGANEEATLLTVSGTIGTAPIFGNGARVEVRPDHYGSETYWRIINSTGELVSEGGSKAVATQYGIGGMSQLSPSDAYPNSPDPPNSPLITYTTDVMLDASDCYTFEIYDGYGDGICCSYGNGSYKLRILETNQPKITGGTFGEMFAADFEAVVTSISENELDATLRIFPNPVVNNVAIEANISEPSVISIKIYDLTGKVVYAENMGAQPTGLFRTDIDFNKVSNGMYLLNMKVGDTNVTRKLSVNK